MKKIIISLLVLVAVCQSASAGWPVIDPTNLIQNTIGASKAVTTAANMVKSFEETVKIYKQGKEYYDALKKVHNLVRDAKKVQQTILMIGDISDIYVVNFQRMLADPYFNPTELEAIAAGYAVLLQQSSYVLEDLKSIVNDTGLSVTDKGRIDIIDRCYEKVYEFRELTNYYTNKTIGVSYLRAKEKNDQDRVLALYGTPSERYW